VRRHIESGSSFEKTYAYARAVVDGDWVLVSGTTGVDYTTMTLAEGVEEQCAQALRNVAAALRAAGCTLDDVVRVRYYVPEREDFAACAPLLRAAFGVARPAATMLVAGLLDERMRIEIEVTARRPEEA
jgi:enamine deaminase RidA (YjgF/YER057c/UK114 family)